MKEKPSIFSRALFAYERQYGERPGRWGAINFDSEAQKELGLKRMHTVDNDLRRSLRRVLGRVINHI